MALGWAEGFGGLLMAFWRPSLSSGRCGRLNPSSDPAPARPRADYEESYNRNRLRVRANCTHADLTNGLRRTQIRRCNHHADTHYSSYG